MQTTLCLLAAVPLLIVGNLAFDPMLALHHHTQLRQFSEASSSHVEGSSQVSILPTTVASLSLSLSLLCQISLAARGLFVAACGIFLVARGIFLSCQHL